MTSEFPRAGGGGGSGRGGFTGVGVGGGGVVCPAHAAVRMATASRTRDILFLCLGTPEDRHHLSLLAHDLEEFPAPLAHVGAPADELLPLLGGGPKDPQVGDVLPMRGIRRGVRGGRRGRGGRGRLCGHGRGSGETISRVLFTRWYEQMVISLGWLSPAISCGLPAAQTTRAVSRCLFGLAPTGGCRAVPVARHAVGSYP